MGYCENTTYVKSADPKRVMNALETLFAQEAVHRIPAPPSRDRCDYEPLQYAPALENDLWGVAVFPGRTGWTVIKTAPLELLSEQAAEGSRMRLSDLCRELSIVGFQVHAYDGSSILLCEVLETGEVYVSGFGDGNSEDPCTWHGRKLREDLYEARFQALPYQDVIAGASMADDSANVLSAEFGGSNAQHCDNLTSVQSLILHTTPDIAGGTNAYFAWDGPTRIRIPACSWEDWREPTKQ